MAKQMGFEHKINDFDKNDVWMKVIIAVKRHCEHITEIWTLMFYLLPQRRIKSAVKWSTLRKFEFFL